MNAPPCYVIRKLSVLFSKMLSKIYFFALISVWKGSHEVHDKTLVDIYVKGQLVLPDFVQNGTCRQMSVLCNLCTEFLSFGRTSPKHFLMLHTLLSPPRHPRTLYYSKLLATKEQPSLSPGSSTPSTWSATTATESLSTFIRLDLTVDLAGNSDAPIWKLPTALWLPDLSPRCLEWRNLAPLCGRLAWW